MKIKVMLTLIQLLITMNTISPLWGQSKRRMILINITEMRLQLFDMDQLARSYPIAVGRPGTPTPTGTFTIICCLRKPFYYAKHVGEVPQGKNNPLGSRWIGLSKKGYGIHGTNNSSSIGKPASAGCIRMQNADVEDLFYRVKIGDIVEITLTDLASKPESNSLSPETNY